MLVAYNVSVEERSDGFTTLKQYKGHDCMLLIGVAYRKHAVICVVAVLLMP